MNVIDGLGDVNGPGWSVVGDLDGDEGDMACELVDKFEGFLDISLVRFHN